MLSVEIQRRAMPRYGIYQNKIIINILFPRVGIEPTVCRANSRTLVLWATSLIYVKKTVNIYGHKFYLCLCTYSLFNTNIHLLLKIKEKLNRADKKLNEIRNFIYYYCIQNFIV